MTFPGERVWGERNRRSCTARVTHRVRTIEHACIVNYAISILEFSLDATCFYMKLPPLSLKILEGIFG
jgi:hypothetical protein